ncbi:MAG: archaeosortase/exosortase family protein [Cyanobacteriota bacterium]|jgi:cyanoexosortase A
MNLNSLSAKLQFYRFHEYLKSLLSQIPPPTARNLWLLLCSLVATQNLIVFTNSQITGNAITALLVWGGALICMEDQIEDLKPKPSFTSLILGTIMVVYCLYRTSRISNSDSFLYFLAPVAGIGLTLMLTSFREIFRFKESLLILCLLPLFVIIQIIVATYVTDDLSLLTAKLVLFGLGILGISPTKLVGDTVYTNGGAVQVMHECNGFEMIMQMVITAIIFLVAFPLRSRLGKLVIISSAPSLGFIVNSLRITLLAIFTSLNSATGRNLFDFFHEQAGSLIFSGLAVFIFGYLYLTILERELPPVPES